MKKIIKDGKEYYLTPAQEFSERQREKIKKRWAGKTKEERSKESAHLYKASPGYKKHYGISDTDTEK